MLRWQMSISDDIPGPCTTQERMQGHGRGVAEHDPLCRAQRARTRTQVEKEANPDLDRLSEAAPNLGWRTTRAHRQRAGAEGSACAASLLG